MVKICSYVLLSFLLMAFVEEEVPKNNLKATQYYQDCLNEDADACGNLGALFSAGDLNYGKPNFERGFFYYEKACRLGAVNRCVRAATFAAKGQGTAISKDKAIQLLTRGCDVKDGESCNNLALLSLNAQYLSGALIKELPKHIPENVMSLFERACLFDSKHACENLKKIKSRSQKK